MSLDRARFFIDGGWAAPATGDTLQVVSPHSEQVVATVPEGIDRPTSTPRSPPPAGPSTRGRGRG